MCYNRSVRILVVLAACAPLACKPTPTEAPLPPGSTFAEVKDAVPPDSSAATQSSGGFALGDINGDARDDLIATVGYGLANTLGQSAPVEGGVQQLLLGQGDGTFATGPVLEGPAVALALATADFDGDGDLDVVLPTAGSREDVFAGGAVYLW